MRSIWKALWSGLCAIGRLLRRVLEWVWAVLSTWVTWLVGAVTYALNWVYDWVATGLSDALQSLQDAVQDGVTDNITEYPDMVPLAAYYLKDVLAMDEAFRLLVLLFGVFLLARAARWVMVPIRALLELL